MKFKISYPQWPPKCVVCGIKTNDQATTYGSQLTSLIPLGFMIRYSYATREVTFPICFRHKIYFKILRFLYFVSFFILIISSVAILPLAKDSVITLSVLLLPILFFFMIIKIMPVRLKKVADATPVIVIRNKEYAQEFMKLNNLNMSTGRIAIHSNTLK